MAKDLATTSANWQNSAGTAQVDYVKGIQATQSDPTQLAIAQSTAAVNGYTQAITSGRWAAKLSAVGKAGWQSASVAKAANYAVGFTAGFAKYQAAMSVWLPITEAAAAAAKAMPHGGIAQSNARSAAFATALYNRKRNL